MKAENLKKMKEANLPVPSFSVVREGETFSIALGDPNKKYAVRSSFTQEDGESDSFAGQLKTYLNVPLAEIPSRIEDCRASFTSDNVRQYREEKGLTGNLEMDVIVQEMVNSELSGVLFTANPQGLLNEMVIVVGRGFGTNVVEDREDTTTYYYHIQDEVYYYEGESLLTREEVETLVSYGKKVEDLFGHYQDIEFAIAQKKIYLLQARPITTLKGDHPLILDNSNIVESYPGITLPLTDSFVHMVYSSIFKGVVRRILKSKKVLHDLEPTFQNMVGSSNGRMYYKISNWYAIIECLPFSAKIIPVWQEMLGVENKEYQKEKRVKGIYRFLTYTSFLKEFLLTPRHMKKLNQKFEEIYQEYKESFHENITKEELVELYSMIREKILSIWDITLINDLYAFLFTGLFQSRMKKKYPEESSNDYISSIQNIESMKPIQQLLHLSLMAYEKNPQYEEAKKEYIELYGDRSLEELKLESKTFRTNPELLEEKIAEYLEDDKKLKANEEALLTSKKMKKPKGILLNFFLKRAKVGIQNRELSRLHRSRIYGMVREIFLKLGSIYVEEGLIREKRDIFYLTMEEVFAMVKYPEEKTSVIEERVRLYEGYQKLPNYTRLVFEEKEFDKQVSFLTRERRNYQEKVLEGTPTSGGAVEGEVLVVFNVQEVGNVKDKILVTKMTDPGWVFLLASAKGIISEKGSLLSHTAIIARELKVPSVVGVSKATEKLQTGMRVRLDGNTGRIEVLGD